MTASPLHQLISGPEFTAEGGGNEFGSEFAAEGGGRIINIKETSTRLEADCVIQVDYRTEDGNAKAQDDYIPVSGTLAFGPNDSVKQIGVEIVDDEGFEEDSEFFVRLSNVRATLPGVKISLETPTATVMILDNDHGGVFEFEGEQIDVSETLGTANIKVN